MCGPLTCMVFQQNTSRWAVFQYHAFRLLSYVCFTLMLFVIGSIALKTMTWDRFSKFILWFLIAFVWVHIISQFVGRKIKQTFPRFFSYQYFPALLGSVTGLFPCGLLIPAYIGASSMPSKSMSSLAIFFFFAGTLPALLISQSILQQVKKKVPIMLQPWLNSGLGVIFLLAQVWMLSKH